MWPGEIKMATFTDNHRSFCSALFVDFDNIYISLSQHDNDAASQFAASPEKWLNWLEKQLPSVHAGPEAAQRRILIRRCYLNPQTFGQFRPYFIRSAFEVIDCPPLTTRGKTSTDIHMVMDILDALSDNTYFDEFILLSGDADFTPVLLRIRKHARYSVVLSVGYVSPAYKAACDYLITQDAFLRDALGIGFQDEDVSLPIDAQEVGEGTQDLLDRMAARLENVAAVPGGIEASELPDVYKEYPEFRQSTHWLGFNSLRRLTQAILSRRQDLVIVEEDPWRVAVSTGAETPLLPLTAPALVPAVEPAAPTPIIEDTSALRSEIAQWIVDLVQQSEFPVLMAPLAQAVMERFGSHLASTLWLGAGTFKGLLTQLELGNLVVSSVIPGYVYDPNRHRAPSARQEYDSAAQASQEHYAGSEILAASDHFAARHPELAPLARKIHKLTDTPYLMPEHYALLLQELAREINEGGYHLTRVSKTVRDRCVEKGAPVARSHVNFVLIGIGYTGYRFGKETESPLRLGEALVQNIKNLCRTAQLDLTEVEQDLVREWVLGCLPN